MAGVLCTMCDISLVDLLLLPKTGWHPGRNAKGLQTNVWIPPPLQPNHQRRPAVRT